MAEGGEEVGVGGEQQRRAVEDDPIEDAGKFVEELLDFAQIEKLERIDNGFAGRHDAKIGATDTADAAVQRRFTEEVLGDAGLALALEKIVDDGAAEIEVGQEGHVAGKLGLGEGEVNGGERFALGGGGAGDDDGMDGLEALEVI